jgi:hypothetical protein
LRSRICALKVAGTAAQQKRLFGGFQQRPSREGETVMPALLWVEFWSSMMASAACLGELPETAAPNDSEAADAD